MFVCHNVSMAGATIFLRWRRWWCQPLKCCGKQTLQFCWNLRTLHTADTPQKSTIPITLALSDIYYVCFNISTNQDKFICFTITIMCDVKRYAQILICWIHLDMSFKLRQVVKKIMFLRFKLYWSEFLNT